jgi:uncharacterized membrane protein YkvA (DUF1232 family)
MSAASILPSPDRIAKAMKRAALRIPFMDDVLAMYYCAVDPSTPGKTRLAIGATLLYLVLPLDIIPDFLPIIGYTDDATALMILLRFVSSHVTDRHKQLAKARLTTALGEDETESNAAA